ncbi:hypothetical protein FQA47_004612 [Oryzias melastigma]|uniref:Uncharacterized protein n=1 Tax=Oryzias melastigma TaxID=30732 RepID=A0A834L028_ORYME|nr:hypothetical protein FQA47_004612 [Oryzias melastigma]
MTLAQRMIMAMSSRQRNATQVSVRPWSTSTSTSAASAESSASMSPAQVEVLSAAPTSSPLCHCNAEGACPSLKTTNLPPQIRAGDEALTTDSIYDQLIPENAIGAVPSAPPWNHIQTSLEGLIDS